MATGFQRPPSAVISSWQHPLRGPFNLLDWLFRVPMQGKFNCVTDSFTLATGVATTTTLSDPRIGGESGIILIPMDANASTEYATGAPWISARADGSCTINHSASALTRTFMAVIVG